MPSKRAQARNSKVQGLTIIQLIKNHYGRYRELYSEEKETGTRTSDCASKARGKLKHEFPDEFREIYLLIKKDFQWN